MDASQRSAFDGIVCFGGVDWWYHNRGHYDLQMMREMSANVPVLYVNSIGMRPPRVAEGAMFLTRVRRKLRSLGRGLVQIRPNFAVFSPLTLPGGGSSDLARSVARKALALQVKRAARRAGIRRPVVWVACPPAAPVVAALEPVTIVYQRTDRFEAFAGVDPQRIGAYDQALKQMSDLVLYCSRALHAAEAGQSRNAVFIDHGVDFDRFEAAGRSAMALGTQPSDLSHVRRPRVGFVGGIDAHTFDPEFFLEVAGSLPDLDFMMVGACSLPEGWCDLPNVHFLGQRPYEEVAGYMAACEVLIMPWNRSDWIRDCNPVKLKEYLATGRPVVSTWFSEVDNYRDHVAVATDPVAFAAAVRAAIADPGETEARRERVRTETWANKAAQVETALNLRLSDPGRFGGQRSAASPAQVSG